VLKVKPKLQLTLPPNKLSLFTMPKVSKNTKLMSPPLPRSLTKRQLQLLFMINTRPVRQRLLITRLLKSIEINHNAKCLAQFQNQLVTQKIFQLVNQLNQLPHTVRALLS